MAVLSASLSSTATSTADAADTSLPTTKRALAACGFRAVLGFVLAYLAYRSASESEPSGSESYSRFQDL